MGELKTVPDIFAYCETYLKQYIEGGDIPPSLQLSVANLMNMASIAVAVEESNLNHLLGGQLTIAVLDIANQFVDAYEAAWEAHHHAPEQP